MRMYTNLYHIQKMKNNKGKIKENQFPESIYKSQISL